MAAPGDPREYSISHLELQVSQKPQAVMLRSPVERLACAAPPSGYCMVTFPQSEVEIRVLSGLTVFLIFT